jgi:hypothetical protein
VADQAEAARAVLAVAAGERDLGYIAAWIHAHSTVD